MISVVFVCCDFVVKTVELWQLSHCSMFSILYLIYSPCPCQIFMFYYDLRQVCQRVFFQKYMVHLPSKKYTCVPMKIYPCVEFLYHMQFNLQHSNFGHLVRGTVIIHIRISLAWPSVLRYCWFGGSKGFWPVKKLVGCDADLHMAHLMPLPLTVSCLNKIQIG